jgi:hypothetical protein
VRSLYLLENPLLLFPVDFLVGQAFAVIPASGSVTQARMMNIKFRSFSGILIPPKLKYFKANRSGYNTNTITRVIISDSVKVMDFRVSRGELIVVYSKALFGLQNGIYFPSYFLNVNKDMAVKNDFSGGNELAHLTSVLSGSPESRRDLEIMSRQIGGGKFPLKDRGKIEEPMQAGLSYLQVQANALTQVSALLGRLEGLMEHLDLENRVRSVLKEIQLDLALLEDTSFNGFATFVRTDGSAKREVFPMPEKLGKGLIKKLNLNELLVRVLSAAEPDDLDVDLVRKYSEKFVESGSGKMGTSLPTGKGSWLSILLKDEFALEIQANVEKDTFRLLNEIADEK